MAANDVPENLTYTAEHEWVAVDDDVATVGITAYAADALGDVVYVALPAVGDTVTIGDVVGEVESHKSVSEIFAPIAGEVVAVNDRLEAEAELAGSAPYEDGWLFRVRLDGGTEHLLDAAAYAAHIADA
ncbi:glycine cleavage system protein GcvH [Miniimonas arenae]|uniref:Glycine cleavage system H protein n=1 Tax=Miniimonas arenae TaxID=676201 RepID=A0A5C5BB96_9MICO|nr:MULTISPECIES: glycine cleavage system protein GcvH [Miniimonas]TNU73794.1 glycine cleavage system protein GcvH [Miniimonas arenae]